LKLPGLAAMFFRRPNTPSGGIIVFLQVVVPPIMWIALVLFQSRLAGFLFGGSKKVSDVIMNEA